MIVIHGRWSEISTVDHNNMKRKKYPLTEGYVVLLSSFNPLRHSLLFSQRVQLYSFIATTTTFLIVDATYLLGNTFFLLLILSL